MLILGVQIEHVLVNIHEVPLVLKKQLTLHMAMEKSVLGVVSIVLRSKIGMVIERAKAVSRIITETSAVQVEVFDRIMQLITIEQWLRVIVHRAQKIPTQKHPVGIIPCSGVGIAYNI